jgi:hypothetical protein
VTLDQADLLSPAGLDPVLGHAVSGWAAPDSTVVLLDAAGSRLATAVADRQRQFLRAPPLNPRCGFRIPLPAALLDGAEHQLRVTAATGEDLPGSPLRFRATAARGGIDHVADHLVAGFVEPDPAQPEAPVALAALLGDETVGLAVAQPDPANPARRRFVLLLNGGERPTGHRILHVGIIGAAGHLAASPAVLPPAAPAILRLRPRDRPVTMAIKISAPNIRVANEWGDYHFARQLGAALQQRGWVVRVDCQDEWERRGDDVALALRGRHRYRVDPQAVNLMWQISHPDRVADGEMDDYDHIFVASDIYARILAPQTRAPVSALHQATDAGVFHPPAEPLPLEQTPLFVGNSRREYRTLVKWCVDAGIDVAVFGSLWEGVIPERFVRGRFIANAELHRWYGSCGVLLNDHWDTMRDFGFLSNRLFDASAAGAFIITDAVRGLSEVFGDAVEVARDADELKRKIAFYLANPEARAEKVARARRIVLENHTFDHRARTIAEAYHRLAAQPRRAAS